MSLRILLNAILLGVEIDVASTVGEALWLTGSSGGLWGGRDLA